MMAMGARFTRAVAIAPIAFPKPAVVCTIANAGSPVAMARPVAIPMTEPSCRARVNCRSSGKSERRLISVEPASVPPELHNYVNPLTIALASIIWNE
jgi:hypothetical protein